jgi:hypothetical protein
LKRLNTISQYEARYLVTLAFRYQRVYDETRTCPDKKVTEFDTAAAFQFMIELYESGTFRFAKLEAWLRQHARLAGSAGR